MSKNKEQNIFYDPSLSKRHKKAALFKFVSTGALILSLVFLVIFLTDMVTKGISAFQQTYVQIEVAYNDKSVKNTRKATKQ